MSRIGFWLPAEMREIYRNDNEEITCKAVYVSCRRFQVITEEVIKN